MYEHFNWSFHLAGVFHKHLCSPPLLFIPYTNMCQSTLEYPDDAGTVSQQQTKENVSFNWIYEKKERERERCSSILGGIPTKLTDLWGWAFVLLKINVLLAKTMLTHLSVLPCSLALWFGNLTLRDRNKLGQMVKWASDVTGESQLIPESRHHWQRISSSHSSKDSHPRHPLSFCFCPLVQGSQSQCVKRDQNSFVAPATIYLNRS